MGRRGPFTIQVVRAFVWLREILAPQVCRNRAHPLRPRLELPQFGVAVSRHHEAGRRLAHSLGFRRPFFWDTIPNGRSLSSKQGWQKWPSVLDTYLRTRCIGATA